MEAVLAPAGITRSVAKSAISIDKVHNSGEFQKAGTETAQLRQSVTITSNYPSARVSNDMQDNLFDASEFGFASKTYTSVENRVAFLNVPVGTTPEQIMAKLALATGATLYKVLDNKPIITEDQAFAINQGFRGLDHYAAQQVVRYPDNHETSPNAIILDNNGKVQYRAVFFSASAKNDIDNRKADADYSFVSEDIQAELAGIKADATVVASQGLS